MIQRRNAAQAAGRREVQRQKREALKAVKEGLRATSNPDQQQQQDEQGQSAAVVGG
jgi:hypothetical protein